MYRKVFLGGCVVIVDNCNSCNIHYHFVRVNSLVMSFYSRRTEQ